MKIDCVPGGGDWNQDTTWVGGAIPTIDDIAGIVAGATVTIPAGYSASASEAQVGYSLGTGATLHILGELTTPLLFVGNLSAGYATFEDSTALGKLTSIKIGGFGKGVLTLKDGATIQVCDISGSETSARVEINGGKIVGNSGCKGDEVNLFSGMLEGNITTDHRGCEINAPSGVDIYLKTPITGVETKKGPAGGVTKSGDGTLYLDAEIKNAGVTRLQGGKIVPRF